MIEQLRKDAKDFFRAGIEAVEPRAAVLAALQQRNLPPPKGRLFLIAVGKAACAMTQGARDYLQQEGFAKPYHCLVITNRENLIQMERCETLPAGHPIPDTDGERAAKRLLALLQETERDDLVLTLISGGGSAMLPCPPEGISLQDEIKLNETLLASGMPIEDTNLIRQQFSRLKGGGMAREAAPAQVLTLLLSDVPGDDPRIIASGLTAAPLDTPKEADEWTRRYRIWASLPDAMRENLQARLEETPTAPNNAENIIIGSNSILVDAISKAAKARYQTYVIKEWVTGEVGEVADHLIWQTIRMPSSSKPIALCCGGETSVKLSGTGKGGRNQELALRFAMRAETLERFPAPWVFLSGGSDGRDGPTDAAGSLVDSETLTRMRKAGISPEALLANNDSYHALEASGDLLITGATGTNVADAQIFLNAPTD